MTAPMRPGAPRRSRQRFPVRVRYVREYWQDAEAIGNILVYGPLRGNLGMSRIRIAYTAGAAIGPGYCAGMCRIRLEPVRDDRLRDEVCRC